MEEQMMEFIGLILKAIHDAIYTYMTYMAWVKTHLWQFVISWWGVMAAAATAVTLVVMARVKS